MKEHFQDFGVRKWAGDDLIELQAEPLAALQGLVAPYAPCILQGCEMEAVSDGSGGTTYQLHAGLAALKGVDVAGNACVKIVRVEEKTWTSDTVYLSLKCEQKSRTYADGNNKVIVNEYMADPSSTPSDGALKISAADGGPRLVNMLGITQKLNTMGGNAKDVVVTFTETIAEMDSVPDRPELKSGSSLGLLLRQIRKWFDELKDLKALAFKEKVALTDLDVDVKEELDGKVDKDKNKVLSECDFTQILKDKLDGIPGNANYFTYTLPLASSNTRGGVKIGYTQSGRNYPVQLSNEKMYVHVPWTDTEYSHPGYPSRSSGLYKIKVDSQGHVSEVTAVSKSDITALGIPGQDTNTTYGVASTTSAGLMSAADKAKLDKIQITTNGSKLTFSWKHPTLNYTFKATLDGGGESGGVVA